MNLALKLKVVIFLLVSLAAVIGSSLWLSQIKLFSRSYRFQIAFDDLYGLTEGSRVQMMGARVGRVTGIHLRPEVILVDVEINDRNIRIPLGSTLTIGTLTTGGKYVNIIPVPFPQYPDRFVDPGLTILGTKPTRLDTFFAQTQQGLSAIRNFLEDPVKQQLVEDQIQGLISVSDRFNRLAYQANVLSRQARPRVVALDALVAARAGAMATRLSRLRDVSRQLDASARQLGDMSGAFGRSAEDSLVRMHKLSGRAQTMVDQLNAMDIGALGANVHRLLRNMDSLLKDINTLLKLVEPGKSRGLGGHE